MKYLKFQNERIWGYDKPFSISSWSFLNKDKNWRTFTIQIKFIALHWYLRCLF
jgi:hypothetical protein